MEEELKSEIQNDVNTTTESNVETNKETAFDILPRIEDLMKSEKEVKTTSKIEGVTSVQNSIFLEDKPFAPKEDKKKKLLKKRLKIVKVVYACVVALLLTFVGVNAITLAVLNKNINNNTNTINAQQEVVSYLENTTQPNDPTGILEITLNEPRDYSDDNKELTIFDKISILFRSVFS